MHDIICVNDTYSQGHLEFWALHGVSYPIKDQLYTVRDVVKHTTGDIGIRVNEIINPEVPIKHPILGVINMEPSFHYSRFADLQGMVLSYEEMNALVKEQQIQHTV